MVDQVQVNTGKISRLKKLLPSALGSFQVSIIIIFLLSAISVFANQNCPVDFDFDFRDTLPQTSVPVSEWDNSSWGPSRNLYPKIVLPNCVVDPVKFKRNRIVAVAKKYIGLPYKHKHIPAAGGLDCSNYTTWIYNFGFGIFFTSHTNRQSNSEDAGRRLSPDEQLEPGDLLFIFNTNRTIVSHAAMYIGDNKLIDSTKGSVQIRNFRGWYVSRLSHARRPFDTSSPPIANFTASTKFTKSASTVSFDATGSYDPDGSIKSYEWNFGDGKTSVIHNASFGSNEDSFICSDKSCEWISNEIKIKGYSNLMIRADVQSYMRNKLENADYLKISYSIDGGNWLNVLDHKNDLDLMTVSHKILDSGTTIRLKIAAKTSKSDEIIEIKNLIIHQGGTSVVHTYPRGGDYTVTLKVTDDKGYKVTTSKILEFDKESSGYIQGALDLLLLSR